MVRFDHALIFVADLGQAVRDYAALGFTVIPGGVHEGDPTENALVPFADGSYLELIAFRRRRTLALLRLLALVGLVARAARAPLARRFAVRAARGPGLIDVALGVDAVSPVIAAARRAGLTMHGPVTGRRAAADGTPIVWELGIPDDDELPLLIADVTPRALRVPATPAVRHANGVTGVATAVVPVADVTAAARRFREVLGVSSHADGTGHSVDLGTTALTLKPSSGTRAGHPARLVLAAGSPRRLDVRAAHGAVLDLG
jgi:hypothetical protein